MSRSDGSAMVIREPGQENGASAGATAASAENAEQMELDEDAARRLQAKMDTEQARGCAH